MAKVEVIKVSVQTRSALGTGPARALRRAGSVPAVLYGHGSEATALVLTAPNAQLVMHHPGMMDLDIDGTGTASAIIKEMQRDPITGSVLHIDFLAVKADEVIRSVVPIEPHGEPAGSAHGGQLEQVLHEIEIECLPGDLPEFVQIDVSALELDDTMHVSDLVLPEGLTAVSEGTSAVFQVRLPRVSEAAEAAEDEAEEAPAEEAAAAPVGSND